MICLFMRDNRHSSNRASCEAARSVPPGQSRRASLSRNDCRFRQSNCRREEGRTNVSKKVCEIRSFLMQLAKARNRIRRKSMACSKAGAATSSRSRSRHSSKALSLNQIARGLRANRHLPFRTGFGGKIPSQVAAFSADWNEPCFPLRARTSALCKEKRKLYWQRQRWASPGSWRWPSVCGLY